MVTSATYAMLSVQPSDWTAVGSTVAGADVAPGCGVAVMRMTTLVGSPPGACDSGVGVAALQANMATTKLIVTQPNTALEYCFMVTPLSCRQINIRVERLDSRIKNAKELILRENCEWQCGKYTITIAPEPSLLQL